MRICVLILCVLKLRASAQHIAACGHACIYSSMRTRMYVCTVCPQTIRCRSAAYKHVCPCEASLELRCALPLSIEQHADTHAYTAACGHACTYAPARRFSSSATRFRSASRLLSAFCTSAAAAACLHSSTRSIRTYIQQTEDTRV
jgi:hypothetical protein